MAIYTVHEPPSRQGAGTGHADGFRFVRDGVYLWAFIASPIWMIWHGLWLVLVLFVAILALLDIGLAALGMSSTSIVAIDILIAWLVALEGSSLRRWTLSRRGFREAGLVSADGEQEAERRFFENWAERPRASTAPVFRTSAMSRAGRGPADPGVVGLFPEPGSR